MGIWGTFLFRLLSERVAAGRIVCRTVHSGPHLHELRRERRVDLDRHLDQLLHSHLTTNIKLAGPLAQSVSDNGHYFPSAPFPSTHQTSSE